jgi:galactonate dehydratase
MKAVHLMACIPNFLILEGLGDDVPQRYGVISGQPTAVKSHIAVPDAPGLGVDIVEEACAKYPSDGNVSQPEDTYDYQHFWPRENRATWLSSQEKEQSEYRPGSVF